MHVDKYDDRLPDQVFRYHYRSLTLHLRWEYGKIHHSNINTVFKCAILSATMQVSVHRLPSSLEQADMTRIELIKMIPSVIQFQMHSSVYY